MASMLFEASFASLSPKIVKPPRNNTTRTSRADPAASESLMLPPHAATQAFYLLLPGAVFSIGRTTEQLERAYNKDGSNRRRSTVSAVEEL